MDVFKLIAYQFIFYLVRLIPARPVDRRLILLKIDEIGDYVLIRNLLHYFKTSQKYKEHKITFVGNRIFRELYEAYDSSIAAEAIWIDKKKFRRNIFYRFSLLRKIRMARFSDAINLIYSRSWRLDDVFIAVSTAQWRVGMLNDGSYLSSFERTIRPNGIYNNLINTGGDNLFDGQRNNDFVQQLLHVQNNSYSTWIPVSRMALHAELPSEYFVVFPGSGIRAKKWGPEKFAAIARHLKKQYKLAVVVCGSTADRSDSEQFIKAFESAVHDLTGKTSLTELLPVLLSAKCLVSVDTGAVHLAAAVNCPVFGLFSGIHYGRFAPYPQEIANNFFAIYPDGIEESIKNKSIDEATIPMDLVKTIRVEKVIETIDAFFKKAD